MGPTGGTDAPTRAAAMRALVRSRRRASTLLLVGILALGVGVVSMVVRSRPAVYAIRESGGEES